MRFSMMFYYDYKHLLFLSPYINIYFPVLFVSLSMDRSNQILGLTFLVSPPVSFTWNIISFSHQTKMFRPSFAFTLDSFKTNTFPTSYRLCYVCFNIRLAPKYSSIVAANFSILVLLALGTSSFINLCLFVYSCNDVCPSNIPSLWRIPTN